MISQDGLTLIEYFEGSKLTVYADSGGLATVGTGHLVLPADNLKIGDTITQEQADIFLQTDLTNAEIRVKNLTQDMALQQCELDTLISQAYNIKSFSMLANHLINEGKEVYLQKTLLYCKDASGNTLLGLKRRRQAEVWQFQGQSWEQILPQIEAIV